MSDFEARLAALEQQHLGAALPGVILFAGVDGHLTAAQEIVAADARARGAQIIVFSRTDMSANSEWARESSRRQADRAR